MAPLLDAAASLLDQAGKQPDGDIALGPTAVALGAAAAGATRLDPYLRHFDLLIEGVGGYIRGGDEGPELWAEALQEVIGKRFGYGSDEDSEPGSATVPGTIDQRRGAPIALGILYLHVARAQGWQAEALDFPGALPIRLSLGGGRVIVDPADGGQALDPRDLRDLLKATAGLDAELTPAHMRPMENRALLFRLQHTLKVRLLRRGRLNDAVGAVESMLRVAPDAAPLWREAGMMHARLDNTPDAIMSLETYLRLSTDTAVSEEERYRMSVLLQDLRDQVP